MCLVFVLKFERFWRALNFSIKFSSLFSSDKKSSSESILSSDVDPLKISESSGNSDSIDELQTELEKLETVDRRYKALFCSELTVVSALFADAHFWIPNQLPQK